MSEHYKSRLFRFYSEKIIIENFFNLYTINVPSSISVPWAAIKVFLEDDTVTKITFVKSNIPENLFTHANPLQVET